MTLPEPLVLFTRADCHLCELVTGMLERSGIRWRPVDIDIDAALAEEYGLRVPVLRCSHSGRELDYPFGPQEIRRFVEMES